MAKNRERQGVEGGIKASLLLCIAVVMTVAMVWGPRSRAATTELVVSDQHTGLALYGFDPVAYFIDGRAREGTAKFEWRYAGVVWRFCNEGNRAAFIARPADYLPRFGGYDPLAVARGVPASGFPSLFAVEGNRLFLFMSEDSRRNFLTGPNEAVLAAEAAWPKLTRKLVP
jgi:YHS domain-containing protein